MKKNIAIVMGILFTGSAFTQTVSNDFQTRAEINLSLNPVKGLKLSLVPEVRLNESFSVDKYLIEGKLSYEMVKGLELGGSYRLIINPRDEKTTEYLNRFALSTQYALKLSRTWETARYINFAMPWVQAINSIRRTSLI